MCRTSISSEQFQLFFADIPGLAADFFDCSSEKEVFV